MTDIPDAVLSEPLLLGALTVAVIVGAHYQRGLTYREYRFAHLAKCYLFSALDSWARARGRPLVRTKGDADYVHRVNVGPREVCRRLRRGGFSPHLIATAKRRRTSSGHNWAHSQWVYYHDDGTQTEVYLFPSRSGNVTDVYAHVEGAITDPKAHLTEDQRHGDARGAYANAVGNDA